MLDCCVCGVCVCVCVCVFQYGMAFVGVTDLVMWRSAWFYFRAYFYAFFVWVLNSLCSEASLVLQQRWQCLGILLTIQWELSSLAGQNVKTFLSLHPHPLIILASKCLSPLNISYILHIYVVYFLLSPSLEVQHSHIHVWDFARFIYCCFSVCRTVNHI